MINLTDILHEYHTEFISTYDYRLHSVHHRALSQIKACHTHASGKIHSQCPQEG
jgi:hypothetical protein